MNQYTPENPEQDGAKQTINLGDAFDQIVSQLVRYRLWFLGATLFAVVLGYIKYRTEDKVYASRMTGETFSLGDSRINDIVGVLQQHVEYGDFDQLAKMLNMRTADAAKIVSLRGGTNFDIEKKIKGTQMYVDDLPKQVFFVEVAVKDTAMLDELQTGLVRYLDENPVSVKRMEAVREGLTNTIQQIDNQLREHDSLMTYIRRNARRAGDGVALSLSINMAGMSEAMEMRNQALKQLRLSNEINVLVPFAKYGKPISPKLSINLIAFVVPANLLVILLIMLRRKK
jgi:hypothetical protein